MNCQNNKRGLAIVMGRNYASRLGMIRAVGMAGCDVIVIQTQSFQKKICKIDASSKYVVGSHICCEPNKNELINLLLSFKDDSRDVFLMPTDDYTAWAIDDNLNVLEPHFFMPHVNHEQGGMSKLMDKFFQKRIAKESGFNVAKGWVCEKTKEGYSIPEDVVFPCFAKPLESYNGSLKNYIKKCDTKDELTKLLQEVAKIYNEAFLIEEYHKIEKEYAVVGVSFGNQCYVPSVIQMLSDFQGVTATGKIFPVEEIPTLHDCLYDFIKETQLVGMFDVDLYVSEGKLFFNEYNVRLGASGYALTATNANLPSLLIQYLVGDSISFDNHPISFNRNFFVNEKVLWDMYRCKMINYKQYRNCIDNSNVLFIKSETDREPYNVFSKYVGSHFQMYIWRYIYLMKSRGRRIKKRIVDFSKKI